LVRAAINAGRQVEVNHSCLESNDKSRVTEQGLTPVMHPLGGLPYEPLAGYRSRCPTAYANPQHVGGRDSTGAHA
jgi:hypothetical protein